MAVKRTDSNRQPQPASSPNHSDPKRVVSATSSFHAGLIEDYALIGDCHTAALVSKSGSIDWLCWPRFDSPACFAALLGTAENGYWRIAPAEPPTRVIRRYRPGTMILETVFETASGSVALIDFMAAEKDSVVRIVEGRSGSVANAVGSVATVRVWLRGPMGDAAEPWQRNPGDRRAGSGGAAKRYQAAWPGNDDRRVVHRRSWPSHPLRADACRITLADAGATGRRQAL